MTAKAAPVAARLMDDVAEQVRRSHHDAIVQLQKLPMAGAAILSGTNGTGISLVDGVATPIAHGLGRAPLFVRESCPRGASSAGRVDEIRDGTQDRSKVIVLKATGWGATILIDVLVA